MENRIEKKAYETPVAEKNEFQYQEQIASSNCEDVWVNTGVESCTEGNAHWEHLN